MIAPIQQEPRPQRSLALRRAHRLLVSTFFREPDRTADIGQPIPAWKAWVFTAWLVGTVAIYLAHMLRLL